MTVYPYSYGHATLKRDAYGEIYSGKSLNTYICLTTA